MGSVAFATYTSAAPVQYQTQYYYFSWRFNNRCCKYRFKAEPSPDIDIGGRVKVRLSTGNEEANEFFICRDTKWVNAKRDGCVDLEANDLHLQIMGREAHRMKLWFKRFLGCRWTDLLLDTQEEILGK